METKFELTMQKLTQAQVCSNGTWDEALDWIRRENPAGTQNNWSKHEGEAFAPVPCASGRGHHYMFQC